MNDKIREQLEVILKQADLEEQSQVFLRQAWEIDIPREDGPWLKSVFRHAALFLIPVFGTREQANRALCWLLFSLGIAYERHKYADRHQKKGG